MSDPRGVPSQQVIKEADRPLDPNVPGKTRIAVDVESIIPVETDNSDVVAAIEQSTLDIVTELNDLEISAENIDIDLDDVEVLIAASNTKLDTVNTNLGTVQTSIASTNTKLDTLIADLTGSSSATLANVDVLTSSTTLLAANASRKMATFYNDSNGDVFLKFGNAASSTSFTVLLTSRSFFELPNPVYKGIITAIASTTRTVRVTEY